MNGESSLDSEVQSLSKILEQEREREAINQHEDQEDGVPIIGTNTPEKTLRSRVAMASSILEPSSDAEQVANHPFICISIWDFNASPCRRRNTLNPWPMNASGA